MIFPEGQQPISSVTGVSYRLDERRLKALEDALTPEKSAALKDLREAYEQSYRKKYEFCLCHGAASIEMIEELTRRRDAYFKTAGTYRSAHPKFFSPISRKGFDTSPPPPPKGKLAAGHTIPVAISSLRSFFPGNYEFYSKFLEKHNVLYSGPESVSSAGAMCITPPRMSDPQIEKFQDEMEGSLLYWRNAPFVTCQTTRADLVKLLSHFDSDYPAFIFDQFGGQLLGEVDKEAAFSLSNESTLEDCITDDFLREEKIDIDPLAAVSKMDAAGKRHLVYFDPQDGKPKIMSHLDASYYSKGHRPFASKEGEKIRGLGLVVYVGIADKDESLRTIERMYKRGHRKFCIEGALAYRTDVMYPLLAEAKERFPDAFFMVGTADTPEAVIALSTWADAVKVLIGAGDVCDTNEIGMQSDELIAQQECGAAAQGVVSLVIDNLGDRKTFCIKVGTQECIAVQSGGGTVLRRESANPIALRGGKPHKRVDGEAGEGAVKRLKQEQIKERGRRPEDSADETLGYHAEGRTDRWKRVRRPGTIKQFYRRLHTALASVGRYVGHDSLAEMQGKEPDAGARMRYVHEVIREKEAHEIYAGLRAEEKDVFGTIQSYKRQR